MIQVWQAEHSATIVGLDSRFAHDDGLQCRSSRNTVSSARVQARITRGRNRIVWVPKPANVGVRPWASAIPRFKRRCSDRDGNTRLKNEAGRSGKGHAPTAGLSYVQARITNSKTSMSANA